jgi:trimeric autotransporter adhesin
MLVCVFAVSTGTGVIDMSFTPPAGMTERYDISSTNAGAFANIVASSADEVRPTAGATGTRTATASTARNNPVGQSIVLRPAPEPTYIALDDFDDRTVSGSWGTAQTGGTYTSSSDSGVTGGRGWLNGQSMRTSHLQSVQVLNAESMVRIDFPVLQTLGSVRAGLMFRTQGTTTGTAAHALIARVERVVTTGDMSIELRFQDGVTSGTFGVTPLGSFPTSAFSLWMRAQCYTDGGAVRVRARVWIDGDAEPTGTWHLNTTTTNLLASAGGVGCHHHGSSTYNGGQTFFDNFSSVEL